MKDLILVLGLLAGWIVLTRWVLPWLGVPTCMSGCCPVPSCATGVDSPAADRDEGASIAGTPNAAASGSIPPNAGLTPAQAVEPSTTSR